MKDNETKALELSDEELCKVAGGDPVIGPVTGGGPVFNTILGGGTADDGNCGQTVDLDPWGKCTALYNYQCNGCKYKSGQSI